jgi:hypothetical protein
VVPRAAGMSRPGVPSRRTLPLLPDGAPRFGLKPEGASPPGPVGIEVRATAVFGSSEEMKGSRTPSSSATNWRSQCQSLHRRHQDCMGAIGHSRASILITSVPASGPARSVAPCSTLVGASNTQAYMYANSLFNVSSHSRGITGGSFPKPAKRGFG